MKSRNVHTLLGQTDDFCVGHADLVKAVAELVTYIQRLLLPYARIVEAREATLVTDRMYCIVLYCIDRHVYLNLFKSTQSAGMKALKPAANGRYL